MIIFEKKPDPKAAVDEADKNRFEQIRKAAQEKHRKTDAEGPRRPKNPTEDGRLV